MLNLSEMIKITFGLSTPTRSNIDDARTSTLSLVSLTKLKPNSKPLHSRMHRQICSLVSFKIIRRLSRPSKRIIKLWTKCATTCQHTTMKWRERWALTRIRAKMKTIHSWNRCSSNWNQIWTQQTSSNSWTKKTTFRRMSGIRLLHARCINRRKMRSSERLS